MAHDVFISYSANDKTIADAVCATLEAEGIRCWIAPRDATPGMEGDERVVEAIRQAKIMVLVFTANANASPQISREAEEAVNHGVFVMPFRVQNVQPSGGLAFLIDSLHWLDALTPPLEAHLEHLAETVKEQLEIAQAPGAPERRVMERTRRVVVEPELPERGRRGVLVWMWGGAAVLALALITFFAVRMIWPPPAPVSTSHVATAPTTPVQPSGPAPAEWQQFKAMPVTYEGYGVGTANGVVYVAGGGRWFNGQNRPITVVGDLWAYDPDTGSWTKRAAMPTARAYPSVASVNGILYVAGGCADWDCGQPLATVEAYSPATNTWKRVAPMGAVRRTSDFLVAAGGMLYAVGGTQGPGCSFTTSVESYDPSTNAWADLPRMPESQDGAAVAVINSVIYVAGGIDCPQGGVGVRNNEAYDVRTASWSVAARLPMFLGSSAYGVVGGKLYVVGGGTATGWTSGALVFDPAANAWSSVAPVPMPLNGGAYGAVVNGVLYIVGVHTNAAGVYSSMNWALKPGAAAK